MEARERTPADHRSKRTRTTPKEPWIRRSSSNSRQHWRDRQFAATKTDKRPHLLGTRLDLTVSSLDADQCQLRPRNVTIPALVGRPAQPTPSHLQPLWTQLRKATLSAIHSARLQRRKGTPTTASLVTARLVHLVHAAMVRDWQRVRGHSSLAALADGVCCSKRIMAQM